MKADGTIIIDTAIQDDGMKAGSKEVEAAVRRMATSVNDLGRKSQIALQKQAASFAKLNQAYADQERKVKDLEKEVEDYGNKKIPTKQGIELVKEWKEAEKTLDSLYEKIRKIEKSQGLVGDFKIKEMRRELEELNKKIREMSAIPKVRMTPAMSAELRGYKEQYKKLEQSLNGIISNNKKITSSSPYRRAMADIEIYDGKVKQLKEDIKELINSGKAFTLGKDTAKFSEMKSQYSAESAKFKKMGSDLGAAFVQIKDEYSDYLKRLKTKPINKVVSLLKKLKTQLLGVHKSHKQAKKSADKFNLSLGQVIKTTLLYSTVSRAISTVTNGLKEGLDNLAQYSDDTNKALSMLMSSMTRLKNSFATAFSPLLEYVSPTLTKFIDLLAESATWVAQLFAALSGKDTYVRAVKVEEDYAASLKDSNKELEEREKENEKVTFSFDQLIQAQEKSDTDGSGEYTPPTPDEMFVTEEVPNQIKLQADAIKQTFSDLFAPLKQSWDAYGPTVLAAVSNAFSAIKQLAGDVGASFMQVWNAEGYGKAITDDLLITFANLAQTVANLVTQFDKAWVAGDTGTNILRHLGDIILEITGFLREASESLKNWAADLDFSPLLTSFDRVLVALAPIVGTIGDALLWLLENVLEPLAKWGLEQALPAVFDLISAALTVFHSVLVALEPLAQWLWESFLKPLGEWTGELIISAINQIVDWLLRFSDWIDQNQGTVQNFTVIIGAFFAAWEVVNLAKNISSVIGSISDFVKKIASAVKGVSGLSAVLSALASPTTLAVVAIGAVVAAIGLLIYNSEEARKFVSDSFEKIKEAVEPLCASVVELIGKISEIILFLWDNILKPLTQWVISTMVPILTGNIKMSGESFVDTFVEIVEIINNFIEVLSGLVDFIAGVFSGDLNRALEGIKSIFGGVVKAIINTIEAAANIIEDTVVGIINTVTKAIKAVAELFSVSSKNQPSGGYSGNGYYSTAAYAAIPYRMPRLATGTVVPPRAGEFAAILGDNKRETEVVSPLSTIKQALKEALAEAGMAGSGERDIHIELVLDGQRFARAVYKANNQETQRVGVRMVTNG